ncbi:MAG: hypothetical protein JO122_07470, partial [Acetobacteraceae bacterium]|nr:hypothetical protein [Acetobacteraceae bacterium]
MNWHEVLMVEMGQADFACSPHLVTSYLDCLYVSDRETLGGVENADYIAAQSRDTAVDVAEPQSAVLSR